MGDSQLQGISGFAGQERASDAREREREREEKKKRVMGKTLRGRGAINLLCGNEVAMTDDLKSNYSISIENLPEDLSKLQLA